ncbi:MAG: methylmalonyl Co-A mutase-associated GTPase MeaB [Phycisphaera sp.]|nr:methylmalonyl Co-A mutase-associated GTPase MeaB [Phycisphaera sp.]
MSLLDNQPQRLSELLAVAPDEADTPEPDMVLGITGPPGAGKSTLTNRLVAEFRKRYPDERIGVIAVDPSSPFTGGAVLGDRVRMMDHALDDGVFIRSLASRGHLGGLALGVRGVLRVMSVIGCKRVLIETVGVGQSEVEVARVADLVAIVFAPGMGDSVQLLKAGLMEAGDLFVVNKADRDGADALYHQILSTLSLRPVQAHTPHGGVSLLDQCQAHGGEPGHDEPGAQKTEVSAYHLMQPDVLLVSALESHGIEKLADALEYRAATFGQTWRSQRRQRIHDDIRDAILEEARDRLSTTLGTNGTVSEHVRHILAGGETVQSVAAKLIRRAADRQEPIT